MSRLLRVLGAAACAAAAVVSTSLPAHADPAFTPAKTDFVGVGSDTTQSVINALASAYNAKTPAPTNKLASWDATPRGGAYTPAAGCAASTRPDGSGAGITALKADTTGCLDFARSSRPKAATDTGLVFVPFAKDVLTYAFDYPTTNAIKNLTAAELKSVYTCSKLTWSSVRAGSSSAAIKPRLPQSGSGSRAVFLTAIGATEADITAAKSKPGCLLVDTVQENDPAVINNDPNVIASFALSRFTVLGGTSGTSVDLSSRNSGFTGGFNYPRPLFNVFKNSTNALPAQFSAAFGPAGFICSTAGQNVVHAQGFSSLSSGCGVPTV